MKILLTGHKGFIGSRLLKALELNHEVIGIDIKDGPQFDLKYFDMWPTDIDLVIHLAGKSGVRESLKDPAGYWNNNVEASRRLFDRYEGTRILYASSSSAYEPDLNPYAASKYVLEELASRYPDTLGMRFHTVYSNTPREGMFFDKLFNNRLEYVTRHYRDFIHVIDVIEAINVLIENYHISGIIDIGSGHPIKIQELAPELPIRLNTPGERDFTCANLDRLSRLGWKPKYSVEKFLTFMSNDSKIVNINGD